MGQIKRGFAMVTVMFILPALFLSFTGKPVLGAPGEIDQRYQELEDLQKEIGDLKQRIDSTKRTEASVTAELRRLEDQLYLATKELDYIEIRISVTGDRIWETQNEIDATEERLAVQKDAFGARLVSMYKAGRLSYIDVLLTSGSLSEFMSRLHYLRQIAIQDNTLINDYIADRADLLIKKQELEDDLAELQGLRVAEEEKRTSVTSRSLEREDYLGRVQADRRKLEEALDQMEQESRALDKVIKDLQAKGQKRQAHPLQMIWPVGGGWISDYYGNRMHPTLGYERWHSGIDYAADYGEPIRAAEDGTVILAGPNGGYGNCVIVDHGGGVSTLYAHAQRLLVKKGQEVLKGDTVALVGSTGISTGPHLHFEVRVNGQTQNPLDWLP